MKRPCAIVLAICCCAAPFVFVCSAAAESDPPPTPVILDTDIGTDVDDAWAVVLAATSDRIDLRAVTVWRQKPELRAKIAKKILKLLGRDDVPVAIGPATTLTGKDTLFGGWEGKGFIEDGEEVAGIEEKPAAELIVDVLKASERPVTIVTVGGVTNIALALRQAPEVKEKIERLVIMGGSVRPIVVASQTLPSSWESNLLSDIEASKEVLEAGLPITLVPAEVTFHAKLFKHDYEPLKKSDSPLVKGMVAMTDFWAVVVQGFAHNHNAKDYYSDTVVFLHDPLAVYTLINPDAITHETVRIRLEPREKEILTIEDPNGPIEITLVTDAKMEELSAASVAPLIKAR